MNRRYPKLVCHMRRLKNNAEQIKKRCDEREIDIAGVIKGCSGLINSAKMFEEAGVKYIASSRLEQLEEARSSGIKTPFMLIRVPMLTEASDVVEIADISLNSDVKVIEALNDEACKHGKTHEVILMADLGDLREGFWDKDELISCAVKIENELKGLKLSGVATNLGCYGAIRATVEKMNELIDLAHRVEQAIGRKLKYIGGGATTSLPLIIEDNMPEEINLLRLGEGILLSRDLPALWGYDMGYMSQDVFTLEAEVIEVKDKPSHPVGEIMFDAFGFQPEYEDRGIRKRALLGIGKVDYAYDDMLEPKMKGIEVLGASSDHTILDIEGAEKDIEVGDILEFSVCYATLVFLSHSDSIAIEVVDD